MQWISPTAYKIHSLLTVLIIIYFSTPQASTSNLDFHPFLPKLKSPSTTCISYLNAEDHLYIGNFVDIPTQLILDNQYGQPWLIVAKTSEVIKQNIVVHYSETCYNHYILLNTKSYILESHELGQIIDKIGHGYLESTNMILISPAEFKMQNLIPDLEKFNANFIGVVIGEQPGEFERSRYMPFTFKVLRHAFRICASCSSSLEQNSVIKNNELAYNNMFDFGQRQICIRDYIFRDSNMAHFYDSLTVVNPKDLLAGNPKECLLHHRAVEQLAHKYNFSSKYYSSTQFKKVSRSPSLITIDVIYHDLDVMESQRLLTQRSQSVQFIYCNQQAKFIHPSVFIWLGPFEGPVWFFVGLIFGWVALLLHYANAKHISFMNCAFISITIGLNQSFNLKVRKHKIHAKLNGACRRKGSDTVSNSRSTSSASSVLSTSPPSSASTVSISTTTSITADESSSGFGSEISSIASSMAGTRTRKPYGSNQRNNQNKFRCNDATTVRSGDGGIRSSSTTAIPAGRPMLNISSRSNLHVISRRQNVILVTTVKEDCDPRKVTSSVIQTNTRAGNQARKLSEVTSRVTFRPTSLSSSSAQLLASFASVIILIFYSTIMTSTVIAPFDSLVTQNLKELIVDNGYKIHCHFPESANYTPPTEWYYEVFKAYHILDALNSSFNMNTSDTLPTELEELSLIAANPSLSLALAKNSWEVPYYLSRVKQVFPSSSCNSVIKEIDRNPRFWYFEGKYAARFSSTMQAYAEHGFHELWEQMERDHLKAEGSRRPLGGALLSNKKNSVEPLSLHYKFGSLFIMFSLLGFAGMLVFFIELGTSNTPIKQLLEFVSKLILRLDSKK